MRTTGVPSVFSLFLASEVDVIPGIKEPGLEKIVELSELRCRSGVRRVLEPTTHFEEVSILQVSE